jgi:RNA polymerase sigma-54 factor
MDDELLDNPLLEQSDSDNEPLRDKDNKDTIQDFMGLDEYVHDDIPDYKNEYANYLSDDMPLPAIADDKVTFREELKVQYRQQHDFESEYAIADYLVDSLNDDGMLDQELEAVCESLSFYQRHWVEYADVEKVLVKIQQLDPPGTGARDLQECLLLKLGRMNNKRPDVRMANCLVKDHFRTLRSGNLDQVKRDLKVDEEELRIILKLLSSLSTRPSVNNETGVNPCRYILPDFFVRITDGKPEISLRRQYSADLSINRSWMEFVIQSDGQQSDRNAIRYLKNKLQSAQWFISAIKERETNMLKIMRCIVEMQMDYFQDGDIMQLKPMILKNVAEKTDLDISTVSRIISNKYAETAFGTIALKKVFSEGLHDAEGCIVSNKVVQKVIQEIIEKEDKKHPHTDQQIGKILLNRGYILARRTVAKYREQLHIPVALYRGLKAEIV